VREDRADIPRRIRERNQAEKDDGEHRVVDRDDAQHAAIHVGAQVEATVALPQPEDLVRDEEATEDEEEVDSGETVFDQEEGCLPKMGKTSVGKMRRA
jgi:hypothetical protein